MKPKKQKKGKLKSRKKSSLDVIKHMIQEVCHTHSCSIKSTSAVNLRLKH